MVVGSGAVMVRAAYRAEPQAATGRWARMTEIRNEPKRALKTVERIDKIVADRLALDGRTRAARRTGAFAEAGDQPPLIILSLSVVAAGLAGGNARIRRTGMRMLTAHSLSTLFKLLVKDRIDRTRPGEDGYRLEKGNSRDRAPAIDAVGP